MHDPLLKCNCDAMHEHLIFFKQNPTQNFCKNLINLKKPQKFSKTQEFRLKRMKCMIKWEK